MPPLVLTIPRLLALLAAGAICVLLSWFVPPVLHHALLNNRWLRIGAEHPATKSELELWARIAPTAPIPNSPGGRHLELARAYKIASVQLAATCHAGDASRLRVSGGSGRFVALRARSPGVPTCTGGVRDRLRRRRTAAHGRCVSIPLVNPLVGARRKLARLRRARADRGPRCVCSSVGGRRSTPPRRVHRRALRSDSRSSRARPSVRSASQLAWRVGPAAYTPSSPGLGIICLTHRSCRHARVYIGSDAHASAARACGIAHGR
jgi:hypothetical protein